jgi:hypothetical protein
MTEVAPYYHSLLISGNCDINDNIEQKNACTKEVFAKKASIFFNKNRKIGLVLNNFCNPIAQ